MTQKKFFFFFFFVFKTKINIKKNYQLLLNTNINKCQRLENIDKHLLQLKKNNNPKEKKKIIFVRNKFLRNYISNVSEQCLSQYGVYVL